MIKSFGWIIVLFVVFQSSTWAQAQDVPNIRGDGWELILITEASFSAKAKDGSDFVVITPRWQYLNFVNRKTVSVILKGNEAIIMFLLDEKIIFIRVDGEWYQAKPGTEIRTEVEYFMDMPIGIKLSLDTVEGKKSLEINN